MVEAGPGHVRVEGDRVTGVTTKLAASSVRPACEMPADTASSLAASLHDSPSSSASPLR